jgi:hypothetical protein
MHVWDWLSADTWPEASRHALAVCTILFVMVAMWLYHLWAAPRWRRWCLQRIQQQQSFSQSTDQE